MKFLEFTFAHQGGWDEVLLVAVPLSLLSWLLWIANRRAIKISEKAKESTPD